MTLDTSLRKAAYELTLARGRVPSVSELCARCDASETDVRDGLIRLAAARMLVLQPSSGELLMVPPFSAVPTSFLVETFRHSSYANCAWDALGVPVMLNEPAKIATACGCCGESMTLQASADATPLGSGVIHFAVPARRWWDDVVFT
jgi:hypothetical protein